MQYGKGYCACKNNDFGFHPKLQNIAKTLAIYDVFPEKLWNILDYLECQYDEENILQKYERIGTTQTEKPGGKR